MKVQVIVINGVGDGFKDIGTAEQIATALRVDQVTLFDIQDFIERSTNNRNIFTKALDYVTDIFSYTNNIGKRIFIQSKLLQSIDFTADKIIVIGHSLGSVVAWDALSWACMTYVAEKVHLVLVGSPMTQPLFSIRRKAARPLTKNPIVVVQGTTDPINFFGRRQYFEKQLCFKHYTVEALGHDPMNYFNWIGQEGILHEIITKT